MPVREEVDGLFSVQTIATFLRACENVNYT